MSAPILVLAPRGRDASIIAQLLQLRTMDCLVCDDGPSLAGRLDADTGGVLVTEEALGGRDVGPIVAWLAGQPAWSDLPVVVLASKQMGRRSAAASTLLDQLGNVVILERPVSAETLVSAVRAALRARQRQHQAKTFLEERERNEMLLQRLNETLEVRVEERARELEQARETLAFALDSAEMGFWDLDLSTGEARRSPQHDRIFGYPDMVKQWDREAFLRHVAEDDRPGASAAFAKAVATGAFDLECQIRRIDGQLRWIAAKGRIGYGPGGQPARMAGIVMDISDRRFTEDALRHSQKMQAIGQLTGGLAHDFNNLLTGITGSLEIMQTRLSQGRTSELTRYIVAAQGAATRAAALTHRLLAFSRRQTLDPKPTNTNRLIADMEELIRRTVGPFIHLETILAAGLWPTLCDPNQLENAMLNFCINARDAMPDGGRLTIETANTWLDEPGARERDMQPGQYVVLCVSDTGVGMPPDIVARAFDPFFTTKPIGTGTGLGLSMAYGFARQSGGQVRIRSEVDRGTTVGLYLPRHGESEARAEAGRSQSVLPPALQGEAVLIVDDEPTVRMLVAEVLEDLGYAALEAPDSQSALAILQSSVRIDLLVTDVGLPGLNGRQLADAARGLRPDLKVMFITGYAASAAVGQGHLETGMHVLTKPFAIDALASKIRQIITQP